MRSHRHILAIATTLLAAACTVAATAPAATSSTVVGATVPSATSLDAAGCPASTTGVTSFGTTLPGGSFVTPDPCTVTFGSSNDTASLRVMQSDQAGNAMHRSMLAALDTSFDSDGIVTFDVNAAAADEPGSVWSDPATGNTYLASSVGVPPAADVRVARLLPDGSPDPSFGTGGVRTYDLGGDDRVRAISPSDDGSELVLAGTRDGDALIGVVELDGTPTSYDGDGWRIVDLSSDWGMIDALVPMPAGGFAAKYVSYDVSSVPTTRLLRLDARLDTMAAWGTSGVITIPQAELYQVATTNDGRIYGTGRLVTSPTQDQAVVARVNVAGQLDTGFAGDGVLELDLGAPTGFDMFSGLEPHDDGSVLVGGAADTASAPTSVVASIRPDGTLDPGFGSGGEHAFTIPGIDMGFVGFVRSTATGGIRMGGGAYNLPSTFRIWTGRFDSSLEWSPIPGGPLGYALLSVDPPGMTTVSTSDPSWDEDGDVTLPALFDDGADTVFGAIRLDAGAPLPDYATGVNDWDDGTSFFGVCAAQVVGAVAVADWTTGACTAADGAHWRALPTGGAPATAAHTTGPTAVDAQLDLHFGLRLAANTAPGDYEAPIRFEVVAPAL